MCPPDTRSEKICYSTETEVHEDSNTSNVTRAKGRIATVALLEQHNTLTSLAT